MTNINVDFKKKTSQSFNLKIVKKIIELEFVKICDELIHCKENGCKSAPRDQPEKNVRSGFVQIVWFVD